ncbi:MAG: DUF2085 domain-containing protein [Candidatus Gastranaerophilales bacterium]|nr:DUF2085 domain-containing protein [Candidatus Gastranaerophilales bacterium]
MVIEAMKNIIKSIIILFFIFYSLFFVAGSTLSPVFAYLKLYDYSAFLTGLYMSACHQQPDRSFWILGYPLALCCRCYGFYIGVVLSAFLSLWKNFHLNVRSFYIMFVVAAIDIVLNFMLKINTGNSIRFLVGIIMGFLFIAVVNYLFEYKKEWKNAS